MRKARICIAVFLLFPVLPLAAQRDVTQLLKNVRVLADPSMKGRGYIDGGVDSAANYISKSFGAIGLHSFRKAEAFEQHYSMPVNTFPGKMMLKINGNLFRPGVDFVIHPASKSIHATSTSIQEVSARNVTSGRIWKKLKRSMSKKEVVILKDIDTVFKYTSLNIRKLAYALKDGIYIVPVKTRLHWLASSELSEAHVIYVKDSILPAVVQSVEADIESNFIHHYPLKNIAGYVEGTSRPDSFIVFSGHYDHLGEMGRGLVFPGANDNASGIAILLQLAEYYSRHPARYSTAFIAFSGEEAGLKGSKYFVKHPLFPLKKIRFLLNMDIMGDATNGITVINATGHPAEFSLFEKINNERRYLPKVVSRDQTKNSDHYPFSKKHVRAFYIYANGVKPFYHDIYDRAEELNFENGEGVISIIRDFVGKIAD